MLTKEECEKALDHLIKWVNADNLDDMAVFRKLIDEHFEFNEKYSKILDDIHDYRYETHCMKLTIINLCKHFGVETEKELKNFYLNKPYKFEDLKLGIPIFDNDEIYYGWNLILMIDIEYKQIYLVDYEGSTRWVNFEENRFYPVQMANVKGDK